MADAVFGAGRIAGGAGITQEAAARVDVGRERQSKGPGGAGARVGGVKQAGGARHADVFGEGSRTELVLVFFWRQRWRRAEAGGSACSRRQRWRRAEAGGSACSRRGREGSRRGREGSRRGGRERAGGGWRSRVERRGRHLRFGAGAVEAEPRSKCKHQRYGCNQSSPSNCTTSPRTNKRWWDGKPAN